MTVIGAWSNLEECFNYFGEIPVKRDLLVTFIFIGAWYCDGPVGRVPNRGGTEDNGC